MKRHFFWVFAVLTLGWMTFIFCMSAQTITESKETSGGLTLFLAELFYGKGTVLTEAMLEPISVLVRKTAHMVAYAVLFLLSFGTMHFYKQELAAKWKYLIAYGWTVFYAMTDEVHQIFSGRGALVADVIIDAMGALIGVVVLFGIVKFLTSKGCLGKIGWVAIAFIEAFGIYVVVFLLFHPDVIKIFL